MACNQTNKLPNSCTGSPNSKFFNIDFLEAKKYRQTPWHLTKRYHQDKYLNTRASPHNIQYKHFQYKSLPVQQLIAKFETQSTFFMSISISSRLHKSCLESSNNSMEFDNMNFRNMQF
jgi:hypothetical protein